ncbi:MAG: tetratricopeptide repeat protein [Chloroflexota bacterium]|nr:MAG: tetratricopeptide repeat protein [Chloroflexota bacterium]
MPRDYYIRRHQSALGKGLLFRERRRRRTALLLALVIVALIGTGIVFWQLSAIQPVVLAAFGIVQTPTPTALEAARQGDLAFWRGNLNAAIEHYTHAARLAPTNVDIVYELARMHIYRSFDDERNWPDRESALAYANQLVEANPRHGRAFAIQCYALVRLARSEEAAQACNRAITLLPEDANAHAYLALAYYDLARYDVAFEAAQRALQLDPNHLEGNTAYAFLLAASRRADQAIDHFKRAAAYNPRLEFPYFNLAAQALATGLQRGDQALNLLAINAYDTVLGMNRRSVKAYTSLCRAYFAIGERNLARDNCRTAVDIDPSYTTAWRWLGEVHYRLMEYEQAVEAFDTCRSLDAQVPAPVRQTECWSYGGLAYLSLGDCARAMPIFNDVLAWTTSQRAVELVNKGVAICNQRTGS